MMFHSPLEQFIRRRISDETTAEDVLQDVFLKIHQHMETLRDVRKLESWIYQITRNTIIDSFREHKTDDHPRSGGSAQLARRASR